MIYYSNDILYSFCWYSIELGKHGIADNEVKQKE
jgi:hypothetical protein